MILDVEKLLKSPASAEAALTEALKTAETEINKPHDVLVMTSRKLIIGDDEVKSLDIGSIVAKVLVQFLQRLKSKPRYVIAKVNIIPDLPQHLLIYLKGGITSSDMATKGLSMKRAEIVGQAAAGVPLWRCDEPTCKHPGLPYVVFPGNVGSNDTLFEVVDRWRV